MKKSTRTTAFLWVLLTYIVAFAMAWGVMELVADLHLLLQVLLADVAATLLVFGVSTLFMNASFYDPYWSVAPIVIGFFLLSEAPDGVDPVRTTLVLGLVSLWGLRLTWNWARGWTGLDHEDWRYVNLREKTGAWFPLVNLLGIQLFPTILVYLGCLPLFVVLLTPEAPLNAFDGLALVVTLGAILVETIADEQLLAFRKTNTDPQAILASGLWKYSRHPNYFGEAMFWFGLFLFGQATNPNITWTAGGILAMGLLFQFISIPMIDKRMLARRPAYAERMKRVSAWVPWWPGK